MTMGKSKYSLMLMLISCGLIIGCGGSQFRIPDPVPSDMRRVPEPGRKGINLWADAVDRQVFEQLEETLDISRQYRNVSGNRKQAMNIDAFDEVGNSSWFVNRNGSKRMTLEAIAKGPDTSAGPDMSGSWTVVRAKTEGVTPGFTIQDATGTRYVMKFDPIGYSELTTGAELVSTKLFHAVGYHVPENYLVFFKPSRLELGKEVKFTDKKGRTRAMTASDLEKIINTIEKLPDGRIRAVASKYIIGIPKGYFRYKGTHKDDYNDIISHQHRRELRGLRVVASWLNHYDTKAGNTYIAYDPAGYMKHYLIDFGSTLGSQGNEPMPPNIGHENTADINQVFLNLITLGVYVPPWYKTKPIEYTSIGYFRSDIFRPQRYKFITPNPAFELMTNRDGYWGAKMVMSFTEEQIRTAIAQGQYSNPDAAEYLFQILHERQRRIGEYWFNKMNPVDQFKLQDGTDGKQSLCFDDLAVESGLEMAADTEYRYEFLYNDKPSQDAKVIQETCLPLPATKSSTPVSDAELWSVKIQTKRAAKGKWSKWVKVYMRPDASSGKFKLVGVLRQE